MKNCIFVCTALIVLGGVVYICCAMSKSGEHPNTVSLIFSGGELGYLEPCGCSEGQFGGITRRDSFLQKLRANGNAILPIANGNLIGSVSRQSELKAEIGFFALADMGYIAYNVGERDIQLGITYLSALSEQNGLPLISANLYHGTSPVFTPYLLHTVQLPEGAITIAVVGFISPNYTVYAENTNLLILEPNAVLKALRQELTENVDLIVCLFSGTEVEASKLQDDFPLLDIVVVSNESTAEVPISAFSDRQLVNTETKGKVICSAKVHWDPSGHLVVEDLQRHLLDEQIPDSQRMVELLVLYQQMVADEKLAASAPRILQETDPLFVGTVTCKTCHIAEWTSWRETKHAHAYHTLEVAGHETDPECLTCHTVGFGSSSGFLSVEETPDYLDVGCENCHGAGSTHVKQHSEASNIVNTDYGAVTQTTCLSCHTTENSPNFDLKEYFPKILHILEGKQ